MNLLKALKKIVANQSFQNDDLAILESLISSGDGTYDTLMSKDGDEEWEFYIEEEDGELDRADWAKDKDEFNLQIGNPAHYFNEIKKLTNPWLIHFTDKDPQIILKQGFKGKDFYGLGLTVQFKEDGNLGDLAFAYPISNIRTMFRYGENAVLIKVPEALQVYHIGDEETQAIFNTKQVEKMYGLISDDDELILIDTKGKELKRVQPDKKEIQELDILSSTISPITEEEFFEEHQIDPEDMNYLGSGSFGEAYLVDDDRVLKKTYSKSEYRIATMLEKEKIDAFADVYAVAEIKGVQYPYYILQEKLEEDSDIEDIFIRVISMLETQELAIQYFDHFDEDEYIENDGDEVYEGKIDPLLLAFLEELQNIVRGYRELGIEASDIRAENLGRDKKGTLKAFDIDDRNPASHWG